MLNIPQFAARRQCSDISESQQQADWRDLFILLRARASDRQCATDECFSNR